MALLCNKDSLINRLRSAYLLDQLVDHESVGDDTRISFPSFGNGPAADAAASAKIAKFFLRPDSSPAPSVSSSVSSRKSPPVSPLSRHVEPRVDQLHSSHSDTDTDYDFNDGDYTQPQLNDSDSEPIRSPLYDLALEDDSDLEEDMVLAAQQLKHTVYGNGPPGVPGPGGAVIGAEEHPNGMRKSISSNMGFNNARRPSKQRSLVGVHTEIGSVLTGSVLPVRRHSDFPLSSFIDAAAELNSVKDEPAAREIQVGRVTVDESPRFAPSLLSQQIQQLSGGIESTLRHYKAAASCVDGCQIKVYLPSKNRQPITLQVRKDCPVYMALGYTLHLYSESNQEPKLTEKECDLNSWNVRLVEDDGIPDEDFPALDRVRPISSYSVDEIALVPATDEEFRANSAVTPNKFTPQHKPTVSRAAGSSGSQHMSQVRVYLYPYDPLLSEPIWVDGIEPDLTVRTIFEQVCKTRMLEQDMYVLRLGATKQIVSNSELVSTLDDLALEMTPRRALQREEGAFLPFAVSPVKAAAAKKRDSRSTSDGNNDALLPPTLLGYYHYKVWRRQQMKILGRQRRELAIDGEYIRIQPPEDRMAGENEKTTQFHIKRVGRVKQSSKVSTNFKILVYKDGGPKYYFLEGETPEITRDIVNRISSMMKRHGGSLVPRF